jgi:hypothetical protein
LPFGACFFALFDGGAVMRLVYASINIRLINAAVVNKRQQMPPAADRSEFVANDNRLGD